MVSKGGRVGSTLKLRKSRVCLYNFILAAIFIVFKDKTAWFLFCNISASFAVQGTGERKRFILVTPWFGTLETWILLVLFCSSGYAYITTHK